MKLQTKRVYEPAEPADGFRVLADRLWPRGVKKEAARIDLWAKEITPTAALRVAFHSDRIPWQEFAEKYETELRDNPALDTFIGTIRDQPAVTLLCAGKVREHSHVDILVRVLRERLN